MPPRTAIKATAAAGGCRQRRRNIPKIDREAAKGSANNGAFITMAQLIPISAESVFPAITAHGCAMGL